MLLKRSNGSLENGDTALAGDLPPSNCVRHCFRKMQKKSDSIKSSDILRLINSKITLMNASEFAKNSTLFKN